MPKLNSLEDGITQFSYASGLLYPMYQTREHRQDLKRSETAPFLRIPVLLLETYSGVKNLRRIGAFQNGKNWFL